MLRMSRPCGKSAAEFQAVLPGVVPRKHSGSTPGYYRPPCQGFQLAAVPEGTILGNDKRDANLTDLCENLRFLAEAGGDERRTSP